MIFRIRLLPQKKVYRLFNAIYVLYAEYQILLVYIYPRRHFVLPMNPQRTELEFAIKNTLTQLGVGVRIGKKKVNK